MSLFSAEPEIRIAWTVGALGDYCAVSWRHLAASFLAMPLIDRAAVAAGLAPSWYLTLRLPLSGMVAAALALSAAAL